MQSTGAGVHACMRNGSGLWCWLGKVTRCVEPKSLARRDEKQ